MNAIKPEWNQLHSTWTGALQAGAAHYFTGKPCKYGHIAPRQTLSSQCMKCASENAKLAYRKKVAAYRIARAAKQQMQPHTTKQGGKGDYTLGALSF